MVCVRNLDWRRWSLARQLVLLQVCVVVSAVGIEAQRKFYEGFQDRVNALNSSSLDKEQRADLGIIKNNLNLSLLELNTIQSYKHNPTVYVELAGNALFAPYVLEYAPKDRRYQHIIRRLEKVPALFEQAKANLLDAPEVWNRVAREENDGTVDLIDKTLRAEVPEPQKADFEQAAGRAIAALKDFNGYLAAVLSKKTSDWRLGRDKYVQKFNYILATGKSPEQLLAEAEADLKSTRQELERLAAPKTPKQALDDVARQHSSAETYVAQAKRTLEQATAFVRERSLVTLPSRSNLGVIETPEFMRGIYAVGGFNAAPPLQPELGAFYWITPIPKNWSKDRVESKLREYNDYGLQHLTVHEAMPGHYVQLEYANDVEPKSRRLLRNVFGSGPYIEGWAVYAQELMTDQGYLNNDPGMRLTWYGHACFRLEGSGVSIVCDPYTPENAGFFCVEPVSHMTDAVNRDGPDTGLHWLAPGETLSAHVVFAAAFVSVNLTGDCSGSDWTAGRGQLRWEIEADPASAVALDMRGVGDHLAGK